MAPGVVAVRQLCPSALQRRRQHWTLYGRRLRYHKHACCQCGDFQLDRQY